MTTDPIADLLAKMRNAIKAKKDEVKVQTSKNKIKILQILLEEGYIEQFEIFENKTKTKSFIKVKLKYKQLPTNANAKISSINGLKQISKPGLRVYAPVDRIPYVLNGLGIAIISTSHGLMTDRHARKQNVGGEVVAFVW